MKRILYLIVAAAMICGCSGDKNAAERIGSIHGVVTDKATGEPVRAAGVQLNPAGLKAVTDDDGQYEFIEQSEGIMVQKHDIGSGTDWTSAQSLCKASRVGGYSDWRFPSIGELSILYERKSTIGNFSTGYYTSSSYSGSGHYYYLNFSNGNQISGYSLNPSNTGKVRAVRTLP